MPLVADTHTVMTVLISLIVKLQLHELRNHRLVKVTVKFLDTGFVLWTKYYKNKGEVCWNVHPQTGSMS